MSENTHTDQKEELAQQFLAQFGGDLQAALGALRQAATTKGSTPRVTKYASRPVVVRVDGVSKDYKVHKQKIEALRDVSLEIRQGEFVAFTGPSGSGKSTLLQVIGGLDKPTKGTILVDEQDITKLSDRKLSEFRNKTIGFVFQFFYLQPFLRLETNLEVPGMFAGRKKRELKPRAEELAKAVGLLDRLTHLPKELSGGQMQRAAIARALLNKPTILLADEPTGNLDSINGRAIINLFEQIREKFGTTIVVVTHDPKVAAFADRELVLKDGEIAG